MTKSRFIAFAIFASLMSAVPALGEENDNEIANKYPGYRLAFSIIPKTMPSYATAI